MPCLGHQRRQLAAQVVQGGALLRVGLARPAQQLPVRLRRAASEPRCIVPGRPQASGRTCSASASACLAC